MLAGFDARIASPAVLRFIRECQARAKCSLAGGVALSGGYLGHRLSRDIDLFFRDQPMVAPLSAAELRSYRDDLRDRLRRVALPA